MNPVTVVSGLPRSGTSMLMNALQAGGHPVLVDEHRPPDAHNPRGYFEIERVKRLAEEAGWLFEHQGQAIKIIYRLLYHLPAELPVRVLFMERSLPEVIASQNAMLGVKPDGRDWVALFQKELQRVFSWLREREVETLRVSHRRMLRQPREELRAVLNFLQTDLDLEAMVGVIDQKLYRQREDNERQREDKTL